MSYKAIVCKIVNIQDHPNADSLNIGLASGYQVVVSKDIEEETLGIFFSSDGQLSHKMCHENNLYRHTFNNKDPEAKAGFFEDNRRIRAIKLRGAKSEGFWTQLSVLEWTGADLSKIKAGDTFSELNGKPICKKYYTKATRSAIAKRNKGKTSKRSMLKASFPDFKEHYSTEKLRMMIQFLPKNVVLTITEKCHGTSGRTGYLKKKIKLNWFKKTWNKLFSTKYPEAEYKYVSGTRKVVIDPDKSDKGYYKGTDFRNIVHGMFVKSGLKKGETVYYEIVGYDDRGSLIMGTHGIKDKKLKKVYGDKMQYTYGCEPGEYKVLIYRITNTLEDGTCYEMPYNQMIIRAKELEIDIVPHLYGPFIYDDNQDALMSLCEKLSQGSSTLDEKHIREGVVVRVEAPGHDKGYKYKSFWFCELEGIKKNDDNYIDPEDIV